MPRQARLRTNTTNDSYVDRGDRSPKENRRGTREVGEAATAPHPHPLNDAARYYPEAPSQSPVIASTYVDCSPQGRAGPRERRMVAGPPLENCYLRVEEVMVQSKDAKEAPYALQLSKNESKAMVNAVRRFGSASRMQDIAKECNHYVAEELDDNSRKVI